MIAFFRVCLGFEENKILRKRDEDGDGLKKGSGFG